MDLSKFQDDTILAEWMLSETEQGEHANLSMEIGDWSRAHRAHDPTQPRNPSAHQHDAPAYLRTKRSRTGLACHQWSGCARTGRHLQKTRNTTLPNRLCPRPLYRRHHRWRHLQNNLSRRHLERAHHPSRGSHGSHQNGLV